MSNTTKYCKTFQTTNVELDIINPAIILLQNYRNINSIVRFIMTHGIGNLNRMSEIL